MVSRKRPHDEVEAEEPAQEPSTLNKLRNMWQFANLSQYLHLFIDALKFDKDFDIEDLENECIKPQPSQKLAELGLALLKHISWHKGLTLELFDEYARRQFVAKAPKRNPFGTHEIANKFDDFDVFTKIRVLQQLSVWTLNNPNSIREKLNATDAEQLNWRIEPVGWDRLGRIIFVLDDSRLYCQTNPPDPKPKPKAKSKKSKSTRSSKRRKVSSPEPENPPEEDEADLDGTTESEDDGLGGAKWECLCITLEDYQDYMGTLRRSKDANEKDLYQSLQEDVLPVIEQQAEERAKKEARRLKELENQMKLATAKRSSRISARLEKQKEVEEAEEIERKRQSELAMARAEQERQRKREEERDSRMMTREQRLKEREATRILNEEKLRKAKEDMEKLESNEARMSERHLRQEMQRREQELQKLSEEDQWIFDCEKCGKHGDNYDDGTHSMACEKCNVWQHSKCYGFSEAQAERDDFHFVCTSCKRKEEAANQPKLPPLKLRLTSASPSGPNDPNGFVLDSPRRLEAVQAPVQRPPVTHPGSRPIQSTQSLLDGPSLSPRGQALGPPGIHRSEAAYGSPQLHGSSSPVRPQSSGLTNGFPTSSPPQYRGPRPFITHNVNSPLGNSSPFAPSRTLPNPPYGSSFDRPASSAGLGVSPVKHSPAPSPKPTNGMPIAYNFNSPHSSLPPSSAQRPSFSPTKHSSPPPPLPQMSSPAPQMPAQMLPDPIPAPSKHDGARPISSHSSFGHSVLPPVKSLSPDAKPQILSPPVKKSSPAPERQQLLPLNGNGVTGSQQ